MRRKELAARVWAKLVLHEREHALFARGDRVLAAVSGGPDSVCLAHFLSVLSRREGFWLGLAHVHHGLRGREADRDEAFVRRLGARLGVPVRTLRVKASAAASRRGAGLEEAARKVRYAALARLARALRCETVAAGHQLDDQAETVLLNLLRGTRLAALGGIPPSRPLAPRVALVRPLLPISREEVLAYLRVQGLDWRLDRTNLEEALTRNWLRRRVLPRLEERFGRVREHLAGVAAQVRALPASRVSGAVSPARAGSREGGRRPPRRRS